jgi:hypothetical protein
MGLGRGDNSIRAELRPGGQVCHLVERMVQEGSSADRDGLTGKTALHGDTGIAGYEGFRAAFALAPATDHKLNVIIPP